MSTGLEGSRGDIKVLELDDQWFERAKAGTPPQFKCTEDDRRSYAAVGPAKVHKICGYDNYVYYLATDAALEDALRTCGNCTHLLVSNGDNAYAPGFLEETLRQGRDLVITDFVHEKESVQGGMERGHLDLGGVLFSKRVLLRGDPPLSFLRALPETARALEVHDADYWFAHRAMEDHDASFAVVHKLLFYHVRGGPGPADHVDEPCSLPCLGAGTAVPGSYRHRRRLLACSLLPAALRRRRFKTRLSLREALAFVFLAAAGAWHLSAPVLLHPPTSVYAWAPSRAPTAEGPRSFRRRRSPSLTPSRCSGAQTNSNNHCSASRRYQLSHTFSTLPARRLLPSDWEMKSRLAASQSLSTPTACLLAGQLPD